MVVRCGLGPEFVRAQNDMGVSEYERSPIIERETRRPEKVQGGLRTKPRRPEKVQGGKPDVCKNNSSPGEGAGWKFEHVHTRRPEKVGWEGRL